MKTSGRKSKKRRRKPANKGKPKSVPVSAPVTRPPGTPKPRRKLPDAMRDAGLDEQSIAQCFAKHISQLQSKKPPRVARKLLLDFLKECVRILYAPARRGAEPEQPATIELVHFVPRPDRSGDTPPSASISSPAGS